MKKVKLFFTALVVLVMSTSAFAQKLSVKGVISDAATGDALPGVAVQLKGSTTTYALTDASGSYAITAPSNGTLLITCLGYASQEIAIDGKSVINVGLNADTQTIDDVIVVAYGTVRREANTGSVTSLKGDALAEAPVTSIDKMLQGKMAGVEISSLSGQPGSSTQIRIRGISSINAGTEPLWVVDGIPVMTEDMRQSSYYGDGAGGSNTNFLNPNDIESITVLKDAAAASVYGSRAANGVILVTTKSGREGKSQFTARVKFGAQQLANDNNIRPLTGMELVNYWRDAALNGGYNPDDPTSEFYVPYSLLENGTHNWYKDLTRVGLMQEYEVNATGGNNKGTYYASIAYHKNDGISYGNGFDRFSVRVNADYQIAKRLKTGARVSGSFDRTKSNTITGSSFYNNPFHAMFSLFPWTPLKNPDGSYSFPAENGGINPRAVDELNDYNEQEYRFNGTMFLEWKPIPQLTLKTNNSIDFNYNKSRMYDNPAADPDGVSALQMFAADNRRLTTSNTINYADEFSGHSLHLLAGQEAMLNNYEILGGYSPNVDPYIPYPTTSTSAQDQVLFGKSDESLLSFFGIFDYNYGRRYFLSASVRGDGSSLFGRKTKWGLFWSASASWNIANEPFMANASHAVSTLKLRGSYGVNGNNNIPAYLAYGVYSTGEYNGAGTMYPSQPANDDLSWEKNKTWDVGFDFGFIDDRISGTIDYYDRLTEDMLLSVQLPYTTGFSSAMRNVGSIRNRGLELSLNLDIFRDRNGWNWSIGGNIAANRSKVLDLAGNGFLTTADNRYGSGKNETPVRIVEGMSMYNFYIREYAGVNPSTGEGLFVTEDGTLSSDRSLGHYIYAGSPEPKCTGGFNTEVSWKGLSLGAYFQFVYGNKVLTNNWFITDGEDCLVSNSSNLALNYWKNPGDTGCLPKPIAGGSNVWYAGYSTRFLEDGSYLRIKDVTLSYSLQPKALQACHLKGLRFYVSALNPFTFHNVKALDPELGELGYAYGGNYPMTKSFIGGIEVSF